MARGLIVACVGNDALDTGGVVAVEAGGRQLDDATTTTTPAVDSWHAHSGVDLVGAVAFFFVVAGVGTVPRIVTVFWVDAVGRVATVLVKEGGEFFLSWCRVGHGGERREARGRDREASMLIYVWKGVWTGKRTAQKMRGVE